MRTGVQQNDRAFRNLGDVGQSAGEVEATGFRVVITVLFNVESGIGEQWNMVTPGRLWQLGRWRARKGPIRSK